MVVAAVSDLGPPRRRHHLLQHQHHLLLPHQVRRRRTRRTLGGARCGAPVPGASSARLPDIRVEGRPGPPLAHAAGGVPSLQPLRRAPRSGVAGGGAAPALRPRRGRRCLCGRR